jgi:hypothetical protein
MSNFNCSSGTFMPSLEVGANITCTGMYNPPGGIVDIYTYTDSILARYDQGVARGRGEWATGMPYPSEPHASIHLALRLDSCYQATAIAAQSEFY